MSDITGSNGRSGRTGEFGGWRLAAETVKMRAVLKKKLGGVDGLVSDAKTYADMMAAESRAACKHI